MTFKWKKSSPLTVGVEWELQILDRETLQPKDVFEDIYNHLPKEMNCHIHREIYQSMLEIVTPPLKDENEIYTFLTDILNKLKGFTEKNSVYFVGLGTLFKAFQVETKINPSYRYKLFSKEFQEILKDFYIYGIHIHIGIPNADWAINAFNNLVFYAPLLLAFSANSIFYRGKNTGIHSYRMVLFERLPRAELPRQLKTFEEFQNIYELLLKNGVIESIKDIWWHIRPRPDLGTIEVRVFDSFWDLERLSFLVKLIRAIALYSREYREPFLPPEIIKQNWWWAKRYSLDADFVDLQGRKSIRHVAFDLIYKLERENILKKLNYTSADFAKFLRKPSLAKELALKAKAMDIDKVIRMGIVA